MRHFQTLVVTIRAPTTAELDDAVEALARCACDVSNSMSEDVHISIVDGRRVSVPDAEGAAS